MCHRHYWNWRRSVGFGECLIDGCSRPLQSRGLCNRHYTRLFEHGDPEYSTSPRASFLASETAVLYLLTHERLGAHKIGIMHTDSARLQRHRDEGWQVCHELVADGETVDRIETDVLAWWRFELHLPPHVDRALMPQGGYTETVDAEAVSIPDVWAFVMTALAGYRQAALSMPSLSP
jgi:hypothetical protein